MSSNKCLSDPNQVAAWKCASGALLKVNVKNLDYDTAHVYMENIPLLDQPTYGALPPSFEGQTGVSLMYDKDEPNKGAAYFFIQQYNKTVLLPEDAIVGTALKKRSLKPEALKFARRGSDLVIERGTKPWMCFWNMTMLEGFIYIDVNASMTGSEHSLASQLASATSQLSTAPTSEPTAFLGQEAKKGILTQMPSRTASTHLIPRLSNWRSGGA